MPFRETPHKCDECGNQFLIDIGQGGMKDAILHTGGPGSSPRPIDQQWGMYLCVSCRFIGPWKKHFAGGSRELMAKYKELLDECRTHHRNSGNAAQDLQDLRSLLDSQKALSTLPGQDQGLEHAIAAAVEPLTKQLGDLRTELQATKQQLQKRKGGRPFKCTVCKNKNTKNPNKICDSCKEQGAE